MVVFGSISNDKEHALHVSYRCKRGKKMELSNKKKMVIFFILTGNVMMTSLLQTALNTALSPIMEEMRITAATVQWLSSAYSLVLGIMMMATSFLFRRFQTKKICVVSVAVVVIGCVVSAQAASFPMLLTGRLLQAAGGGILTSLTSVVILTIFPKECRGTMMGIYGLCTCFAPVLAPVVGGVVVEYLGWNMLFWICGAIFAFLLVFAIFGMKSVLKTERIRFDMPSMLLCSAGFAGLLIGFGYIGSVPVISLTILGSIVFGAICMVLFCFRQLKMPDPFMDLRILRNREFRLAMLNGILMMMVMMALVTMLPLCCQSILGFSATQSGLLILPGSIVMGAVGLLAGRLYDKLGAKTVFLTGGIISLAGTFSAVFLRASSGFLFAAAVYALVLLGPGILGSPVMTWGMSTLKLNEISPASAMFNSVRTIAGAFGSAVFVGIMTAASGGGVSTEYGMRVSFSVMMIPAFILFVICLMSVRRIRISEKKYRKRACKEENLPHCSITSSSSD